VPEPSVFEVEFAIEKLKSHNSLGINQIPAEMIKRTICYEIHKVIISIWSMEELTEKWKKLSIVPICKKGDKTDYSNYRRYHFCQLCKKF
jgi:hypothetical protein